MNCVYVCVCVLTINTDDDPAEHPEAERKRANIGKLGRAGTCVCTHCERIEQDSTVRGRVILRLELHGDHGDGPRGRV